MGKRGELTRRIEDLSKSLLGYEMGLTEFRLMPYILYVMVNEQRIDPNKINADERDILARWRQAGYIEGGASGLNITENFWNILCKIVFAGYVDIA